MFFYQSTADYSKTTNFKNFLTESFLNDGYCHIYGRYEYYVFHEDKICDELFGHAFKTISYREWVSGGVQEVEDIYGNKEFKEVGSYETFRLVVYRRDLLSVEDEILRYAHFTKYIIDKVFYWMREEIRDARAADNPLPEGFEDDYKDIEFSIIRDDGYKNHPKFLISSKEKVEQIAKKYGFATFTYDFVSEIKSPLDKKFQELKSISYQKAKEREAIHSDYLLAIIDGKVKIEGFDINRTKTGCRDAAAKRGNVFLVLFIVSLVGLAILAISTGSMNLKKGDDFYDIIMFSLIGLFFFAVMFFILMLINKKKGRGR